LGDGDVGLPVGDLEGAAHGCGWVVWDGMGTEEMDGWFGCAVWDDYGNHMLRDIVLAWTH